ncbi:protein FAM124B [Gastrophryne carolinensis]
MDAHHSSLSIKIHLFVCKRSLELFRQAIDRLLQFLSIDAHPFQVSEQPNPVQTYACRKPKSEFPGISVTLFLREDLGEERISLLQSFFQLPPWDHINIDLNLGQSCSFGQMGDFYCLDAHTPVWGLRPVHYGFEILRITLYCTCDNYDDTVQLYETILGIEAISQRFGFCFFVLYSTKHTTIQLALKQLPPEVAVHVKDACALQFNIQAVGQLVPLLPFPCVPISGRRWQTRDYDGNKILLLVAGSSKGAQTNKAIAPNPPSNPCTAKLSPLAQPTMCTPEEEQAAEMFPKSCSASSQKEMCRIVSVASNKTLPRPSLKSDETETNVDTGDHITDERHQPLSVYTLSRGLRRSAISGHRHSLAASFKNEHLPCRSGDSKFPQAVKQNKGDISSKILYTQRSQWSHSNGTQLREEFFI